MGGLSLSAVVIDVSRTIFDWLGCAKLVLDLGKKEIVMLWVYSL